MNLKKFTDKNGNKVELGSTVRLPGRPDIAPTEVVSIGRWGSRITVCCNDGHRYPHTYVELVKE